MNDFHNPSCCDSCHQRVICHCLQVTEAEVLQAMVTLEVRSIKDVRRCTGAGDGCTACHRELAEFVRKHSYASAEPICSVK